MADGRYVQGSGHVSSQQVMDNIVFNQYGQSVGHLIQEPSLLPPVSNPNMAMKVEEFHPNNARSGIFSGYGHSSGSPALPDMPSGSGAVAGSTSSNIFRHLSNQHSAHGREHDKDLFAFNQEAFNNSGAAFTCTTTTQNESVGLLPGFGGSDGSLDVGTESSFNQAAVDHRHRHIQDINLGYYFNNGSMIGCMICPSKKTAFLNMNALSQHLETVHTADELKQFSITGPGVASSRTRCQFSPGRVRTEFPSSEPKDHYPDVHPTAYSKSTRQVGQPTRSKRKAKSQNKWKVAKRRKMQARKERRLTKKQRKENRGRRGANPEYYKHVAAKKPRKHRSKRRTPEAKSRQQLARKEIRKKQEQERATKRIEATMKTKVCDDADYNYSREETEATIATRYAYILH